MSTSSKHQLLCAIFSPPKTAPAYEVFRLFCSFLPMLDGTGHPEVLGEPISLTTRPSPRISSPVSVLEYS